MITIFEGLRSFEIQIVPSSINRIPLLEDAIDSGKYCPLV